MAMVPANNRRANTSLSRFVIPALAGLSARATDSAVRQIINNVMGSQNQNSRGNGGQNVQRSQDGGGRGTGRRTRRGRQGRGGGGTQGVVQDPTPNVRMSASVRRSLRVTTKGVGTLTNSVTNGLSAVWNCGWGGGGGNWLLAVLTGNDKSLVASFEYARIHRFSMKYAGTTPTTTSGVMALGYTPNHGAATATLGDVTNCPINVVQDVKGVMTLSVVPDIRDIYLRDVTQDLMHRSVGLLIFNCSNNLAMGTQFGLYEVSVDLTLFN